VWGPAFFLQWNQGEKNAEEEIAQIKILVYYPTIPLLIFTN
jgi:hypothetical protein